MALKEQQCVSQAAQYSLARAIQAEREARDQLRLSIEHHRVAQDVALRRISESQKLQNDAETILLRETAGATAAEDRLVTDAAIRTSLEEQLQSLRFSHESHI